MATNLFERPSTTYKGYKSGKVRGCFVDTEDMKHDERKIARRDLDEFLADAERPLFGAAAPEAYQDWQGKLCTPWFAYLELDPRNAMQGRQKTGDCVSWGVRNAIDISRSVEIIIGGEAESYILRQATAMLYAERGHTGQGASPSRISRAATEDGILLERIYTKEETGLSKDYDFRDYDEYVSIGIRAGRTGLPEGLKRITRKNRCKTASLVTSMEEAKTALWNGYALAVGSSIGVSNRGGYKGQPWLSTLQGSWAHEMSIVGFDDRPEIVRLVGEPIYFWDQSWGNWNRISGLRPEWLFKGIWPEGAFILTESHTWRAVKARGCFAHSDTDGFPPRRLPDWGVNLG